MEQEEGKNPSSPKTKEKQSASGKRKPRVYAVEPRTPLKRQRIPVQKYQSPATEEAPAPKEKEKPSKEEVDLLYKKNTFLAVRGDEGSFYLCRTFQNVFSNTKKFKIMWLDLEEPPDVYKIDFLDSTDMECVLTNVKMERVVKDTYRMPAKEKQRVENILNKSIKRERGELIDEEIEEEESAREEEEESAAEDWEDMEPSPKKAKRTPKSGKKASATDKKGKKSGKKDKGKDKKGKGKEQERRGRPRKKVAEAKEKKKGPDKNLKPNPRIKVLEKEPFFETREGVEFISKTVHGKLAIRAVLMNDMKLLQSLVEDTDHVYKLNIPRSVENEKDALHYALEKENKEAIKILMSDYFGKENPRLKKATPQNVLISEGDTGRYNPMSLGVRNIRAISMSRGSKEGNNAFTKDSAESSHGADDYVEDALKLGVSWETLQTLMASETEQADEETMLYRALENVYQAVLCGHRKLAGKILDEAEKRGLMSGFGYLHKEVLMFDNEDLRQTILSASVRKKPHDNKSITPLHCAAINPNVKYITKLLAVEPDMNLDDREHRRPLHFAAVCDGTATLDFLLNRGANPMDVDTRGYTPLHYACHAGRPRNVDILLKKAKEVLASQGDDVQAKWGPGGVNRPSRSSYCPIHIAVTQGHTDVVKILIKHHVDVNKPLSAGKNKMTPLIIAASNGFLDIARVLVQNGATVELPDKLKKTALMHAVMNGNSSVTSYLLYLGADPNKTDSSGNSVIHYAAAYGWQFCLKLLLDAGADPTKANDWQTTPVSIAFLKGHIGLVDYLLAEPDVDINFKNDAGMTLCSVAASSSLAAGLYEQMLYLIDEKKADPKIEDVNGLDTLHHLAANKVMVRGKPDEEKMKLSVKIGKLLVDNGCSPTSKTADGKTALMLAVEQVNTELVALLVENGGTVSSQKLAVGKTVLHLLAEQCMDVDLSEMLNILVEEKPADTAEKMEVDSEQAEKLKSPENSDGVRMNGPTSEPMDVDGAGDVQQKTETKPTNSNKNKAIWLEMASAVDNEGYTPLLTACKVYSNYKARYDVKKEEIERRSNAGRTFIQGLIELLGSDVSATVQQKVFEGDPPEDEKQRYTKEGKCSAVHLLLHVGHESKPAKLESHGLELILKYKPNLEHRNLDGKTALILAVEHRTEKAVQLLVDAGADPNVTYIEELSKAEVTPLLTAARDGHEAIVKALIDAKAKVSTTNSKTAETALHMAVRNRGIESSVVAIVKILLAAGASINASDQDNMTPFHHAVFANKGTSDCSTDLEELMIEKGADVFAKDKTGRLPLHYTFISLVDPESTSPLDPTELCSVLTAAMQDKQLDKQDDHGQAPLHLAAVRGATICCVHLLQRKVSLTTKDSNGNTPVTLAVSNKHDSCAIMLLQKGAKVEDNIIISPSKKVDWRKKVGEKPVWTWKPLRIETKEKGEKYTLYQGALKGELQGVAHMVLDMAGLNGKAVEAALRLSKYHIALRLLKRIRDSSLIQSYTNDKGQNLLHVLALLTDPKGLLDLQLKVAQALFERGVRLNQEDRYQRTPLMYAAMKHQPVQLGRLFIEKDPGADLNKKDKYGRTVIGALLWHYEKTYKDIELTTSWLKMLMASEATVDNLYPYPHSAHTLFDLYVEEEEKDFFAEHLPDCAQLSALLFAIHHSDFGLTQFLLKNGASPNLADDNGLTPLMHAIKLNDLKIVKLLLNYDYTGVEGDEARMMMKRTLSRQHSRQVFAIMPTKPVLPVPVEEEEEEDEDEGDDDVEEEDIPEEEDEDQDNAVDEAGEHEEPEESDHDTDVVSEEEEEEAASPLPIPRLGSKQISMKRQGTSVSKDEFPLVQKTSSVELNAVDSQGWTAIHHLVCPLEYGTYDDEEMLYVLAKAGASINRKDNAGLSPLDHALIRGAVKLARMLQTLSGTEQTEKPTFPSVEFADGLLSSGTVDYEADAAAMLKQFESENRHFNSEEEVKPKPDERCMFKDSGEVVYDKNQNIPYDVVLSKIDVRNFLFDQYNFYKMQIIWHKGKDIYVLFTRWGRIGDIGQFQHTPFQKLSEAIAEFCKIFRSKTGNFWLNVKQFVNQPKKYRIVLRDNKPKVVSKVTCDLKSDISTKLVPEVQELVKEMADVDMMQSALMAADIEEMFMPFGRMRKEALIEARKLLQEIGELIVSIDKQKRNPGTRNNEEHAKNCEKIARLSTEYYNLVPQHGYAYERVHPINDKRAMKSQLSLIHNLLDIELASKMVLGAQFKSKELNPYDYMYQAMGCHIQPLREDDVESQYILKYIYSSNTKSGTDFKVLSIFKISRPGEEETIRKLDLDNHKLLWHGSGVSNFMSILKHGLMISPPEVPVHGSAFGEGIYTSDAFVKSSFYCSNANPKSDIKMALLCEVALGKIKENVDNEAELDLSHSEYNSLKIQGRDAPDSTWDIALPFGASMPLGCIELQKVKDKERRPWVPYNEFIVQNPDQICLRYLVQFV